MSQNQYSFFPKMQLAMKQWLECSEVKMCLCQPLKTAVSFNHQGDRLLAKPTCICIRTTQDYLSRVVFTLNKYNLSLGKAIGKKWIFGQTFSLDKSKCHLCSGKCNKTVIFWVHVFKKKTQYMNTISKNHLFTALKIISNHDALFLFTLLLKHFFSSERPVIDFCLRLFFSKTSKLNNKVLLYSTRDCTQYSVIAYMGK